VAAVGAHLAAALGVPVPAAGSSGPRVTLPSPHGPDDLVIVVRALDELGLRVEDLALRRPTLDDVFLALTGSTTTPTTSNEVSA
jgi:ABC-2 type transport system ATP-binding protein